MSSSGNVVIHVRWFNTPLYLYSNWDGDELPLVVASALVRGQDRWNDPEYLARIIFCEMVKDSVLDTNGFGISTYPQTSECAEVHVYFDWPAGRVEVDGLSLPFQDFIEHWKGDKS